MIRKLVAKPLRKMSKLCTENKEKVRVCRKPFWRNMALWLHTFTQFT